MPSKGDNGMSFQSETKVKSTRKEHKCEGCLQSIPTGSAAVRGSGLFEGGFYSYIICIQCEEHLTEYRDDFKDGWGEGDIGMSRRGKEDEQLESNRNA